MKFARTISMLSLFVAALAFITVTLFATYSATGAAPEAPLPSMTPTALPTPDPACPTFLQPFFTWAQKPSDSKAYSVKARLTWFESATFSLGNFSLGEPNITEGDLTYRPSDQQLQGTLNTLFPANFAKIATLAKGINTRNYTVITLYVTISLKGEVKIGDFLAGYAFHDGITHWATCSEGYIHRENDMPFALRIVQDAAPIPSPN